MVAQITIQKSSIYVLMLTRSLWKGFKGTSITFYNKIIYVQRKIFVRNKVSSFDCIETQHEKSEYYKFMLKKFIFTV